MNNRLSLLFVCECAGACAHFQNCLEREGCHLLVATNRERAARTLLFPRAIDAVLIHHDSLSTGGVIASGLKLISPGIPTVLVTGEWPSNGERPCGVDALCHTAFLSRRAARDLARFVRHLLVDVSQNLTEEPQYSRGQFVARKPIYLN
jgi:hypothetical protein